MKTLVTLLFLAIPGQAVSQPTAADAQRAFLAARTVTEADGGSLWGIRLDGPVLLADPDTRVTYSSRPFDDFVREGDIWRGTLPDSIGVANTAFGRGDNRWTMLRWPIPEEPVALRRLVAHELWHGVQHRLGFPTTGPANAHLDSRDGRYWLRLEMRALARALGDPENPEYVGDALTFRFRRHELFPDAANEERALMMHEGLAEYTGLMLSGLPREDREVEAARGLENAQESGSFVRSFAYALGPAYGLLLDRRRPEWRRDASPHQDLADMLPIAPASVAPVREYGGDRIAREEDAREDARLARVSAHERSYVTGPRLELALRRMNITFDPERVEVFPGYGSVYAELTLTDEWGTLKTSDGALISESWTSVVVPAGSTYSLELAPGWRLVEGDAPGVLVLRKE